MIAQSEETQARPLRVAEMFSGVGGFRLGLERAGGFRVIWSNQWEPSTKTVQHASDCYVRNFGPDGHSNDDIIDLVRRLEEGELTVPDIEVVVGGFPCQDFSVARPRGTGGIEGHKGSLWWAVYRFVRITQPRYVVLENVDRLLKSPAAQRGRDFAVILESLNHLGYRADWRVVNAAEYGYPQKRRRVFIVAYRDKVQSSEWGTKWIESDGPLAQAFPVEKGLQYQLTPFSLDFEGDPGSWMRHLLESERTFNFGNAGTMSDGKVWATTVVPIGCEPANLGSVLLRGTRALDQYPELALAPETLDRWRSLKGAKRIRKIAKNGHEYTYAEGSLSFPDCLDKPGRTITTSEGGWGPGRSKHVIQDPATGKLRRLAPEELERLNGFPDGWTEGMPAGRRAFMMGNALVVGVVERIARALRDFDREVP